MSDKRLLVIPGAAMAPDANASPLPLLPNLRALLAAMTPGSRIECDEDSPAAPDEIAIARAIGLPGEPGYFPWAAHETGTVGVPCAFVRPCHLRVGADHVALVPARELGLDGPTEAALLEAMTPYFREDGISLELMAGLPGVWLARGEVFRGLRSLSMTRAAGQRMTPDTFGAGHPLLRRLQNEMQMLLYTHPVNDARQARGLLPVNSFWVTGAGVLEHAIAARPEVVVDTRLQEPAQEGDAAAHAQAWQAVDADSCASLLALLRAGGDAQLILCGERAAQSFAPAPRGWASKLKSAIGLQPAWNGMDTL